MAGGGDGDGGGGAADGRGASLFVFDCIPPRQCVGAKAYRKDFEDFLAQYPGPNKFKVSDLSVTI
jgi:ketosteroid isomerase-like protein